MDFVEGLVSVAIPAYKSTFLKESIDSVLEQDYSFLELIIVNDHSPNDINNIVELYKDNRIRYYINRTNLGKTSIVHNWNRCLSLAKGEFFVLLCDDDVLFPDFLSTLLKLADRYPSCSVFHSRRRLYDNQLNTYYDEDTWPEFESYNDFYSSYVESKRHHTISEFLYRTKSIIQRAFIV